MGRGIREFRKEVTGPGDETRVEGRETDRVEPEAK
jgi:hypothetical protein